MKCRIICCLTSLICSAEALFSGDWPQFRGPDGAGIAQDARPPVKWSDSENLKWKTELPGPGASSPIVAGKQVFVTCWSGYGNGKAAGETSALQRHLVCLDRSSGKIDWSKSVAA